MRILVIGSFVLILVAAIGAATFSQAPGSQGAGSRPLVTKAEYERWQMELSNWGRWGKEDEMGTLNLITPAKRKQAAALVKDGFTVSLASNAATEKGVDVPCPVEWSMLNASQSAATDRIAYPCIHGAGTTHLDSFAHVFFNGKMWNGYPAEGLVTKEGGAAKNSILTMKSGIVTRGVLYDIPKLKGVPYLEPGTRIFVEDLEAWEKKAASRQWPAMRFCSAGDAGRDAQNWERGQSTKRWPASIIPSFRG